MTSTALPRLRADVRPSSFVEFCTALFEGIVEAREIHARYDRLSSLSNAELAHVGLTRQDIASVAVNGRVVR
jgi:hypothetical protein